MLVGDHADEESELGGGSLGIGGNVGVVVKGSYSGDVGDFGAGLVGGNALSCRCLGTPRHRGCAACARRGAGIARGGGRAGRTGTVRGGGRAGRGAGIVRGPIGSCLWLGASPG